MASPNTLHMGFNPATADFRFFLRPENEGISPELNVEQALMHAGYRCVAGTDEAGRGPLAGPVVAAAVVLDPQNIPDGLNDSKRLTEEKREALYEEILQSSFVSIASNNQDTIDRMNIRSASLDAMQRTTRCLPVQADALLVDGNAVPPRMHIPAFAMIKGDGRSLSIAAASIIAKTARDRMMLKLHEAYPDYGFAQHKGYPTAAHREALKKYGPCPAHRKSFKPVAEALMS